MALKKVANTDCTLQMNGGTGNMSITTSPSTKVKAGNPVAKGIYRGPIDVLITGAVSGGCTQTSPVTATINPTAVKSKAEGQEVIREDDESASTSITGTTGTSGCSFNVTVKISSAGQDKVKAQ